MNYRMTIDQILCPFRKKRMKTIPMENFLIPVRTDETQRLKEVGYATKDGSLLTNISVMTRSWFKSCSTWPKSMPCLSSHWFFTINKKNSFPWNIKKIEVLLEPFVQWCNLLIFTIPKWKLGAIFLISMMCLNAHKSNK